VLARSARSCQVCDGVRQLEDAMIGSCRELQLAHGAFHQAAAGVFERAELPHLRRAHVGVEGHDLL